MDVETTNYICECSCCAVNNTADGTTGIIVILILIIWIVGFGIFVNKTL